ncbi:50S ribosomal protein L19 [Candidatus Parcubacteria bacterium]|nr:50S ribosomal protein L19 [Candidatus Parcubacteria bacterium]
MPTIIEKFNQLQLKKDLPDIRPGDTVRVHQIIPVISGSKSKKIKEKEKEKEKIQVSEGLVLARKHGKGINATITIRKVISGIGVEKILPIHSPLITKIEIIKRGKVRRAKLFYLREAKGRKARLKRRGLPDVTTTPEPKIAAPEGSEPRPEDSGREPEPKSEQKTEEPVAKEKPDIEEKPTPKTEEEPKEENKQAQVM